MTPLRQSPHGVHSARLHALAAALCALLLLVALGVMDANRAPWWALLAVQGALLATTASAGIWLDRCTGGGRRRGAEASRGQDGIGGPLRVSGTMRYHLPGVDGRVLRSGTRGAQSTEQSFWMERGQDREDEEES